jgi:two-component system phosphate regulon response regulator PhoB
MSGQRILVVEDESDIAEVLRYNLAKEGFTVEIQDRGDTALESIRDQPPAVVLLDLMLPGLDGLEIMRTLRQEPSTKYLPVIMLTAKSEDIDRIVGLELGADDYITKPFSPREVVLRVKALLRRIEAPADQSDEVLEAGAIHLDINGHRLLIGGTETPLTATEFKLLRELLAGAGRVQTRDRLLTVIWGYSEDVDSRTVDTHVRRLRKKLGTESDRIETVVGVGYRLRK